MDSPTKGRGTLQAMRILLLLGATTVAGCFDAPKLEDRWTRIDLSSMNVSPYQSLPGGATMPFSMHAQITYRAIITGFAVAELRASTVPPASVELQPDAPREAMASDIDRILQNSVSLGRTTRAITGWDHLIQGIDFTFQAAVPGAMDTTGRGASGGLFLLCYLGSGDKVERRDGTDTLIVTPFNSTTYQLLPVGLEFGVMAPVAR